VCEGDTDGDGVDGTCGDPCPLDPNDVDSDGDGIPDCIDECPGVDDTVFENCASAIPAASTWGLVILSLCLLVVAKLWFGARKIVFDSTVAEVLQSRDDKPAPTKRKEA
jgi:hypothetical protein